MILMRALSITRAIGRGGTWNRDFIGPWNEWSEMSEMSAIWGPKKSRFLKTFVPITSKNSALDQHISLLVEKWPKLVRWGTNNGKSEQQSTSTINNQHPTTRNQQQPSTVTPKLNSQHSTTNIGPIRNNCDGQIHSTTKTITVNNRKKENTVRPEPEFLNF
jgi:hypothetical protein